MDTCYLRGGSFISFGPSSRSAPAVQVNRERMYKGQATQDGQSNINLWYRKTPISVRSLTEIILTHKRESEKRKRRKKVLMFLWIFVLLNPNPSAIDILACVLFVPRSDPAKCWI